DDASIGLIGALSGDQVGELVGEVNIGKFEGAGLDGAHAVGARLGGGGAGRSPQRAGGANAGEKIVALLQQAARVGEILHEDLAAHKLRAVGEIDIDFTFLADGKGDFGRRGVGG